MRERERERGPARARRKSKGDGEEGESCLRFFCHKQTSVSMSRFVCQRVLHFLSVSHGLKWAKLHVSNMEGSNGNHS